MVKLKEAPIIDTDLIDYLSTESDFAFELHVLNTLIAHGFTCEHGGSYDDPVTKKPREFDIRATKTLGHFHIRLAVECKNVSRDTDRHGNPRVDFQRTRAAKGDPCSRYYEPTDFDVVAACLHAVTNAWDFRFVLPSVLAPHKSCAGRIASNVRVDNQWSDDPAGMLQLAYAAKGLTV